LLRTADELLKIEEDEYNELEAMSINSNGGDSISHSKKIQHKHKKSKHKHHHHHKHERFDESSLGSVKIASISLVNLPRIHKHFNNAPTVSLTCGAWHMSTQVCVVYIYCICIICMYVYIYLYCNHPNLVY